MSTKPFDQFNKRLFQELLSPFGLVIPNLAVLGEERMIDIFFAPHPDTTPNFDELGTLTQMIDRPALLEPFRSALTNDNLETCLIKLFSLRGELERQYPMVDLALTPHLWILAAEVSDRLLKDFTDNQPDPKLGEGFYGLKKGLRTTVVAIAELPETPENLWLRLMGKGTTQENAIEELILLKERDPKRANALNLLVSWRINIEITQQVESEEEQTLMALSQAYLEWEKQTRRQGLKIGLERGLENLQAERRSTITSLMQLRYGGIDGALEAMIPALMLLSSEEYTRLLLQMSRDELIQHFAQ
jgi:hypothetical protein